MSPAKRGFSLIDGALNGFAFDPGSGSILDVTSYGPGKQHFNVCRLFTGS